MNTTQVEQDDSDFFLALASPKQLNGTQKKLALTATNNVGGKTTTSHKQWRETTANRQIRERTTVPAQQYGDKNIAQSPNGREVRFSSLDRGNTGTQTTKIVRVIHIHTV